VSNRRESLRESRVGPTRGAWPTSNASCQRGAQRHQRSPGFNPGKPKAGTGVERSLPRDFENWRNAEVITALRPPGRCCSSHHDKIPPWVGRADIERLSEHVSGATPPTASVAPIVPQHSASRNCSASVIRKLVHISVRKRPELQVGSGRFPK
jgi:hypothetical protein